VRNKEHDVVLHCFNNTFICILTTMPVSVVIISQSESIAEIFGGGFLIFMEDNFYSRFLVAETYAVVFSIGGYWGIFTLSLSFMLVVRIVNWIESIW